MKSSQVGGGVGIGGLHKACLNCNHFALPIFGLVRKWAESGDATVRVTDVVVSGFVILRF